jgi:hypothetical protein
MGQYHILVNLDKREVVHPHGLALGLKQYEQVGCEGSLSDAMYVLAMTSPAQGGGDLPQVGISGRWVGDRFAIVGDYTQSDAIPNFSNASTLYQIASETYTDITPQVRDAFEEIYHFAYVEKEIGNFKSWQRTLN